MLHEQEIKLFLFFFLFILISPHQLESDYTLIAIKIYWLKLKLGGKHYKLKEIIQRRFVCV